MRMPQQKVSLCRSLSVSPCRITVHAFRPSHLGKATAQQALRIERNPRDQTRCYAQAARGVSHRSTVWSAGWTMCFFSQSRSISICISACPRSKHKCLRVCLSVWFPMHLNSYIGIHSNPVMLFPEETGPVSLSPGTSSYFGK